MIGVHSCRTEKADDSPSRSSRKPIRPDRLVHSSGSHGQEMLEQGLCLGALTGALLIGDVLAGMDTAVRYPSMQAAENGRVLYEAWIT